MKDTRKKYRYYVKGTDELMRVSPHEYHWACLDCKRSASHKLFSATKEGLLKAVHRAVYFGADVKYQGMWASEYSPEEFRAVKAEIKARRDACYARALSHVVEVEAR